MNRRAFVTGLGVVLAAPRVTEVHQPGAPRSWRPARSHTGGDMLWRRIVLAPVTDFRIHRDVGMPLGLIDAAKNVPSTELPKAGQDG